MNNETWMNANAAHDLGFCDKIMYTDKADTDTDNIIFDKATVVTNTISSMRKKLKPIEKGVEIEQFEKRLNLLK